MSDWQPNACILCENNCGIEVKVGGEDGRQFLKIRGDDAHPASQGYLCQKATRLNYYQNGRDRLMGPMRRRADGSFEQVSWDTAIAQVAERLAAVRDTHGGDKIFYYGGGGQGNHLPAGYAISTLQALGVKHRSNALAQEKTGEARVASAMFGAMARNGDFEHCEVGVFIGKNPWQSHGIPRARVLVREIARDPERTLVVFDPRVSESAAMADFHIQVKPATDAWALSALLGAMAQDGHVDSQWMAEHTTGMDEVLAVLSQVPVAEYCAYSGVPEQQIRALAKRLGQAQSIAFAEDLGVQMNRHSTLVSYLHRLLWLMTGSFGKKGSQYIPNALRALLRVSSGSKRSPVTGAEIVSGLMPCNSIADEILTDHPARFRGMIVETANPAHSLADSARFARAMRALDFCVVIDIAMSETARHADYILPAPTQYEKAEATFFNFEMPANYFHLRRAILAPPPEADVLTEAEIHTRLVEALGAMPDELAQLQAAMQAHGRPGLAMALMMANQSNPEMRNLAPVALHRVLGPTLPPDASNAAAIWAVAHLFALNNADSLARAGIEGSGVELGESLFEKILNSPSGMVFSVDEYERSWEAVTLPEQRINGHIEELLAQVPSLRSGPPSLTDADFPFVLSVGERRSFTANTIYRDPDWRRKDHGGALCISPQDAQALGLADAGLARIRTRAGEACVVVEVSDRMQPGHVSLPNGTGLDNADGNGARRVGVAPNELTSTDDRDPFVGTPWHKSVPAHIEAA